LAPIAIGVPSHIHLVFAAENNNPGDLLRDYKTHTSKELQAAIKNNPVESRREWLVWIACSDGEVFSGFERAGQKNCNVKNGQFWQQNNKPIELWSSEVIDQKVDYIHPDFIGTL
jgi:putative transposase